MKPYAFLLMLAMAATSFADEADVIATRLESARQEFFAAIDVARAEVITALEAELQQARNDGSLEPVEALTKEKKAFTKQGIFPTSVSTRTFQRKVAIALRPLKKEFDAGIRVYVQQGKIEDAKRLREELKSFEDSPLNRSNWGVAEYTIGSGAGAFKPFTNRARAFPNRTYVWGDVSPSWPIKRFAPVGGGRSQPIKISIKSPGWVFMAVSNEESKKVNAYIEQHSWQLTPYAFSYNARGKTPMVIFRKQLSNGDHTLPRVGFAGPVLLAP